MDLVVVCLPAAFEHLCCIPLLLYPFLQLNLVLALFVLAALGYGYQAACMHLHGVSRMQDTLQVVGCS